MITNRRRGTDRQQLAFMGALTLCDMAMLALTLALLGLVALLLLKNDAQVAALAGLSEQIGALKSSVNTLHRRIDGIPGVVDGRSEQYQPQRQRRRPYADGG